jgi:TonB family protein
MMSNRFPIRVAAAALCTLLVLATAVHAATVRPPELKNRQQVVGMLLDGNAGLLIRNGLSAVAEVMVEVDDQGRVGEVRLVRGTGNQIVDSSLRQMAVRMSFVPATENGKPFRSFVTVPFIFGNGRIH